MMTERERSAPNSSGKIGYGDRRKLFGKSRNSSDTLLIATFEGHSLSHGETTDSVESIFRTCHQNSTVERSSDSIAPCAGHDVAPTFIRLKGHSWPQ
jgi:hypothetical protein